MTSSKPCISKNHAVTKLFSCNLPEIDINSPQYNSPATNASESPLPLKRNLNPLTLSQYFFSNNSVFDFEVPNSNLVFDQIKKMGMNEVPLTKAAIEGDVKFLKDFLRNGTQINIKDYKGLTALHYAAENGRNEFLETLCRYGADIEAEDEMGATPIFYAIRSNEIYCLKLLIEAGANLNHKLYVFF